MTPTERINPFPGMRAFSMEEAGLFFGRDHMVEGVVRRLERSRFVAVLGNSGAGKSSLVRAGVVPALVSRIMTKASWRIAVLRPGSAPGRNLAEALSAPEALGGENPVGMAVTLHYSSLGLVQAVRDAKLPVGTRLLLIVDQFEEVFRYAALGDKDEFAAFVKLLLAAASADDVPVFVLITLRTDFLTECDQFRGLPEAISENLLLVSRMTRDELRNVIAGPAALAGAAIEPRLVDRLLNDAGDERDPLGPLQHALRRTWDRWSPSGYDSALGLADYEAIGGIAHSLELDLDGIFAGLARPAAEIARIVFQRLAEQDAAGRFTLRPTSLSELADVAGAPRDDVIRVLDIFRDPARTFLVPGRDVALDDQSVIDIAHEAIVRWPRLRAWIDEERSSAEVYRRVAAVAAQHKVGLASHYREPELSQALRWRERARPTAAWAQRYDPNFEAAMGFLDASRQVSRMRVAFGVGVVAVLVFLVLALTVYLRR